MFTYKEVKECSDITEFEAWSGGKVWLDEFSQHLKAISFLTAYVEDWATFEEITTTQINDFLWFDAFDLLVEEGLIVENDKGDYNYV